MYIFNFVISNKVTQIPEIVILFQNNVKTFNFFFFCKIRNVILVLLRKYSSVLVECNCIK